MKSMKVKGERRCRSTMKLRYIILAFCLIHFVLTAHAFGECTGPGNPFAIAPGGIQQYGSSVNDLGEVVWLQFDPISGYRQIYSITRGQLTFDPGYRDSLSINNRGDVVWMQDGDVYGIISGQLTRITNDHMHYQPKINDFGEIVTTNFDMETGFNQIHSSIRGQLTFDLVERFEPAINNSGDVVWTQMDSSGFYQIYKLPYGAPAPIAVTDDFSQHSMAAISNSEEVIWAQGSGFSDRRIYSNTRGQLTGECPSGLDHSGPSINSCGDITFTNSETEYLVYRMGTNAPCLSDPEPNNTMQEVVAIGDNSSVTGLLDAASGDTEDWYTFIADEGALINIAANWTVSAQNTLLIEIVNNNGQVLANAYNSSAPASLTVTAPYAGAYYVRYAATGGRFGYNLFITLNHPPVVNAGLDQAVMPDTHVNLTGSANDPDGAIVSYKWTQIEGITVILSDETSVTATFTAPGQSGMLVFNLEATDNRGATTFDTVNVTVNHYTVTPSAGANGIISPSTPQTVNYNQTVSFTITPNTGYHTAAVTGCNGTLNGSTYTTGPISADCTVMATFEVTTYALTVTKAGTGSGTVTSSPSGTNCGETCSASFASGSSVTLAASPNPDSLLAGWNGGGCSGTGVCTMTMDAAKSVTATFNQYITVTAPNGDEIWKRNSTYAIKWSYSGDPGSNIKIELLKGGVLNRIISSNKSRGSNGVGSYNWKVPSNQITGTNFTIRITSTSNSGYTDTSDANFSIQ